MYLIKLLFNNYKIYNKIRNLGFFKKDLIKLLKGLK